MRTKDGKKGDVPGKKGPKGSLRLCTRRRKKRGGAPKKGRKSVMYQETEKKGDAPKKGAQGYVPGDEKSIKRGTAQKRAHGYVPDIIISKKCPKNIPT